MIDTNEFDITDLILIIDKDHRPEHPSLKEVVKEEAIDMLMSNLPESFKNSAKFQKLINCDSPVQEILFVFFDNPDEDELSIEHPYISIVNDKIEMTIHHYYTCGANDELKDEDILTHSFTLEEFESKLGYSV